MMKKCVLFLSTFLCSLSLLPAQTLVNVKDINSQGSSYPHNLIIANDKLFFIAQDSSNYNHLWVSQGTNATTTNLGPFGGVSNSLQELQTYKNKIYFSYSDGVKGQEPWTSDGTTAGTVLLADIYPGSTGSNPKNFTVANNLLFFLANTINGSQRLYVSDGTAANTVQIKDNIVNGFNGERAMGVLNDAVYFSSDDGSGSGNGLWKSGGTAATTTLVKAGIIVANFNGNSAVLNTKMYFNVNDNVHGDELWVTDGTSVGTYLVKDIDPVNSGEPQNFQVYHNKIYFSANDGTHGTEPWVSDGTEAGTQMLKDVFPGAESSRPTSFTVYNDTLYFLAAATGELWKTDGSTAHTLLVAGMVPATQFAAIWNNTMYMISGADFSTYQSNGTAASTIPMKADNTKSAITYYSQFGSDSYFLQYHNELYFQASVAGITTGFELCKLTSAALGLRLLSFTGQVSGSNDVLNWTTANEINTALFLVEQSTDGRMFTTSGQVNASGNSSVNKQYSFTQRSTTQGGDYYRLKMVDMNQTFTYSPVIRLKHDAPLVKIVYQTANRSLFITNKTNAVCHWQLVSTNGAVLARGSSANATISLPLNNVAKGIYMVSVNAKDIAQSLKFVVN